MINGRDYFKKYERELQIEGLPADAIEKLDRRELQEGLAESKRGGRITRDLKVLSADETAERRERSEKFLQRPPRRVAAEEDSDS